ncbi:hypothetical protein BCR39DRAFT_552231 [Naematelia encephala]|uniref:choline-phosphate cytidylyltransferase n=1 Tax=Naematelia encephala TaxID=71784 RepID=A0A1Y2AHQ9_9TREE|nr:hypothetical protein BCR39DRAFT_552231 [Naematelia encephala]
MAFSAGQTKRNRGGTRQGERRGTGGAGSSRDASEEDNDNASDVGSLMSVQAGPNTFNVPPETASPRVAPQPVPGPFIAASPVAVAPATARRLHERRWQELSGAGSQSEDPSGGRDSPTYDGDVESSSTIDGTPIHAVHPHGHAHHARRPSSPTPGSALKVDNMHPAPSSMSPHASQRLPTPKASRAQLADVTTPPVPLPYVRPRDVVVQKSLSLAEPRKSQELPLSAPASPKPEPVIQKMTTLPVELSEDNIRGFVRRAIEGKGQEDGVERWWRTNAPPEGKVVRVYADGVYDLFHFGHALQLRQAKLSFPKVHLLVGVCSDALCEDHKSAPAMTHAERCESVRHCRWADEVLPDAPWVVDQAWLEKHDIDYIAHDELVYPSKTHDDVYAFAKSQGKFWVFQPSPPPRHTHTAISTSDLLERIVRGYRDGFFDSKLEKNGHPELLAADVDWDSSASVERRERRSAAAKKRTHAANIPH